MHLDRSTDLCVSDLTVAVAISRLDRMYTGDFHAFGPPHTRVQIQLLSNGSDVQGEDLEETLIDVIGPSLLALTPAFSFVHVLVEGYTSAWGHRMGAAAPELQHICRRLGITLRFAQTTSPQETQVRPPSQYDSESVNSPVRLPLWLPAGFAACLIPKQYQTLQVADSSSWQLSCGYALLLGGSASCAWKAVHLVIERTL